MNYQNPSGARGNSYQDEDFLLPRKNWLPKAKKQALEAPGENGKY
jgi:hypothetical protein